VAGTKHRTPAFTTTDAGQGDVVPGQAGHSQALRVLTGPVAPTGGAAQTLPEETNRGG